MPLIDGHSAFPYILRNHKPDQSTSASFTGSVLKTEFRKKHGETPYSNAVGHADALQQPINFPLNQV